MIRARALRPFLALLLLVSGLAQAQPVLAAGRAQAGSGLQAYLARHEGTLPPMMGVPEAVDRALAGHARSGGSTTHLRWGDLSGQHLFVVSLFPDLGLIKQGPAISRRELTAFVEAHLDLLANPQVCLGTWFNKADGRTYIDLHVVLADKATAVALAKRYNQISIFDLYSLEETNTGGDGRPMAGLPPPASRIPAFK